MPNTGGIGTGCISRQWPLAFCWPIVHFLAREVPTIGGGHEAGVHAWRCGAGCFLCVCTGRLCSAR